MSRGPYTCTELGVCQERFPPCGGCCMVHDASAMPTGHHGFAPGVIERHTAPRSRSGLATVGRWVAYLALAAVACAGVMAMAYGLGHALVRFGVLAGGVL